MMLSFGVPRERRPFEFRVGLIPAGVSLLTSRGHEVYVEAGAGLGSGFSDQAYEKAGAKLVYNSEEVFKRPDVILKILRPTEEEVAWMRDGQILMGFMMMARFPQARIRALRDKDITVIAYERIQLDDGTLPVLKPFSQIGGMMTLPIAAQYSQNNFGGNGILLGNIQGVPRADVVIIGAGVVGLNAAKSFHRIGANVILMDSEVKKIEVAHEKFDGSITTMVAYPFNIKRVCSFADIVISAVQVPGQPAPIVVTRDMVAAMHDGALAIDLAIDQGGSVETSRLTFHDQPTFVEEGVIHYCVPNIPGVVGRAATHAFLNVAWLYISLIAEIGLERAIELKPSLKRGIVVDETQTPVPVR
jgi:alanine dehydrogenase